MIHQINTILSVSETPVLDKRLKARSISTGKKEMSIQTAPDRHPNWKVGSRGMVAWCRCGPSVTGYDLGLSDVLGLVELAPQWMSAYASSSAGIEGERERGKRSVDRFDPEQPGRP